MAAVRSGAAVCRRCDSPFEPGDLRCAVCGHAAPEVVRKDAPEIAVEVLRCSGCGAAVSYSVRARAPQCAFCGSVVHVEEADDPLEQADGLVPFTVDRARAEAAFADWLGGLGWFRPGDLRSASRLESLQALWWVGWVVSAEVLASWAADSEVGAVRADWAPHAGQEDLRFDDLVVSASRGLTAEETARLLPSYDLASLREPDSDADPDAAVEQFEIRRTAARQQVRSELRRRVSQQLRADVIPGRRIRNLHTSLQVRGLVTRRVGFPAWVIAYRYRGALHRFVMSGQDPDCRVGTAPLSAARIAAAVVAGLAGIAALLALLAFIAS